MGSRVILSVAAVMLVLGVASAHATTLAELDHPYHGELTSVGIELTKPGEVTIDAVGLRVPYSSSLSVYAWLIDSDTRKPVWILRRSGSRRDREADRKSSKLLVHGEKTEFLEKGRYELYMFAGDSWGVNIGSTGKDFLGFLGDVFDDESFDDYDLDDYFDKCYVRVESDELTAGDVKKFEIDGSMPGALVQFNRMGDNEYVHQAFHLDHDMNIKIYALVEHPQGYKTPVDFGWIVNSATGERVWQPDRWNTERAGGGRKNRKFDDEIRLTKGDYVLHFVTDDSHSWERFNMNPPYDPINWGVTLLPGVDFDPAAFHLVEDTESDKPLVDFTRARDNEYLTQAFELKKPARIRIEAIGEYSERDRNFVDYGWIENAADGEPVWEMTEDNTAYAGGADKNRMFEGTIELPAGKYVANYVTDDSHSYRSWNAGQPYDVRAYGLALYPTKDFDYNSFARLNESDLEKSTDVLAKIVRVGDHARRTDRFTLDKESKVHIYALGEGRSGQMYDYAWIENDRNGDVVWEMTYRRTDPAGGADKNRRCDQTITLEPGNYAVHYVSDGSHSFGDWNAAPPRDQRNWGVTVTKAN